MPLLVEPSPSFPAARFGAPDEAHETSYFAASDRIASQAANLSSMHSRVAEGPAGETTMLGAAEQAVHQHDFADRPFDRLDALLGHAMAVAQQSDVRREGPRPARLPIQRVTQTLLQDLQADRAVIAPQNQRTVLEAAGVVEADAERRHGHAR